MVKGLKSSIEEKKERGRKDERLGSLNSAMGAAAIRTTKKKSKARKASFMVFLKIRD